MKATALTGKTIKAVKQARFNSTTGQAWSLEAIEFTDGTVLRFHVLEHVEGSDYGIEAIYPGRLTTS